MKLGELLAALPSKSIRGDVERDIDHISFDSRSVRQGSLFVAIRGWEQDGHRFIGDAVRRGAAAVVAEEAASAITGPTYIAVPNSRRALPILAAAFFGRPATKLKVIGVTGTDGKTTTTTLTASMLKAAGCSVGTLSTIRAEYGGRSVDTGFHTTTPNPVDVQRLLREMLDAGTEYAILETTSHALDQDRTLGCEFDVAVVTNVTPEHLDYHKSYGRYLAAKGQLFRLADNFRKPGVAKIAIVNADDVSYGFLREFAADCHLSYGIEAEAGVCARAVDIRPHGARFQVVAGTRSFVLSTPLPGTHNVYNCLAAATVSLSLGVPVEAIVAGARDVAGLVGRWERIDHGQDFDIVIDFAHTPHALRQALTLARQRTRGRVIVVFGCAGQRDQFKRPVMGEVAGRLADVVILTAEDPRQEDIGDIMRQIAAGTERAGRTPGQDVFQIRDRQSAVDLAVSLARAGDLVLLTGKGHEQSMCFGDVELPWSEHAAVAKAMERKTIVGRSLNR